MSKRKRERDPETSDIDPDTPKQRENSDGPNISTGPDEPSKTDIFDYLKRHNLDDCDHPRVRSRGD